MSLFPERAPQGPKRFSPFDHETERELASAFKRPKRDRPYPADVPYYPWVPSSTPRVSFDIYFNPNSE